MCRWCGEDQSFEVDGITYDPCEDHGVTERCLFELLDTHNDARGLGRCVLCDVDEPVRDWHHMINDGMRWSPDYPIVRFTSEGLQIEEPANV